MYPKQLWINRQPVPNTLHIENVPCYPKPRGSVWTSSYLEDTSHWVMWCEKNKFALPEDGIWRGYLLQAKENTRIVTINCHDDLLDLLGTYHQVDEHFPQLAARTLDFEAMKKDGIDAIHLTSEGLIDLEGELKNLWGWDVESTCWLNPAFDMVDKVEFPVTESSHNSNE